MEYVPPLNGDTEDPDRPWVNANLALGQEGSYFNAPAAEVTQREILNVIEQAGLEPDGEDLTQLYQAIAALIAAGADAEFGAEEDIASAATTDLGTATSKVLRITGTTTITSFGAAADVAAPIYLIRFAGDLTLTHNAASLILPGAVNIAAKAGDTAMLQYLGGGNWKCLRYQKADGKPVNQSFRGDYPQTTITDAGYTVLPADASKMFALEAATAAVELKLADTEGIYNGFSVLVRCIDDTEGVTVVNYGDTLQATMRTGQSILFVWDGTAWVQPLDKILGHLGVPVATTSGSSVIFDTIPPGVKKITMNFDKVKTNGTANPRVQIGDVGGLEDTGYFAGGNIVVGSAGFSGVHDTTGFPIFKSLATYTISGSLVLTLLDEATNTWSISGSYALLSNGSNGYSGGVKSLSGVLDRVALVTTDTFESGKLNIHFE